MFGHIVDTNTQWIGNELTAAGILPVRKTSVGDRAGDILTALKQAMEACEVVIVTGGLGPTKDDITKQVLCAFFETELAIHEEALAEVTAFFRHRGREMIESNRLQAALPRSCTYLANHWGTAPGMWFERDGKVLVSLPGVPFEMKNLMTEAVLPRLQAHFTLPVILHKTIRTVGIGESFLAERVSAWEDTLPEGVRLAYLPSFSGVKLRLTAYGEDRPQLMALLEEQVARVLPLIDTFVYGYDNTDIEEVIGNLLKAGKATLAVAESCTGGFVSYRTTTIPGASIYFMGGVISYSNAVKMRVLEVPEATLMTHGAVSEQTARAMAEGVRKHLDTTYGIATTGVAGPGGGTAEKPVGTVWIACAGPAGTTARLLKLGTLREVNIELTAMHVLNLLRETLLRDRQESR